MLRTVSRWSVEPNHLWFTFPGTMRDAWKCRGPGLDQQAAAPSRDLGAALFPPSWRRRGLNPRLAFQPAPCPLLAAALGLGAAVSPAEEEEQAARGAAPGSGFCTNAEQPRAASSGRPSSPAPRSTVMAREEGRARSATAPAPPPLRCPARPFS